MLAAARARPRPADRHRPPGDRHRGRRPRRLAGALGPSFAAAVERDARRARAGDRLGHGQVRPRRAQDRRDAGLDRHAGALRPSGRGEPRRPRHDHRRGRGAALSNSGETPELADLIAYTRRFAIPLIGVAGRRRSTLLRQSDIAIVLPPAPEACSVGLAPTTSTTMTLALGDALAVALMEHRAFTPEDFRGLHPGGRLGARLATVGDLMHAGDAMPLTRPTRRCPTR